MKHAGLHWPENAGGEHPNRATIALMPGMDGAALICSPSGRYHYDFLRQQNPAAAVVWRAIPRQGKLPAQLGWNAEKVASECLNLWDEQPHHGFEWFLPLNELQFSKESGQEFRGYTYVAAKLAELRVELEDRFDALGQNVGLMFPGWVPQDDGDRLHEWRDEAKQWDAICVHCYGDAETMRSRYQSYRDAFPGKLLFVGEWNSNHGDHDERASLEMWAEIARDDPLFQGATYFIWETNNAGENDLSIWGNPSRLALFQNPPVATVPAPTPEPEPVPDPEPPAPDPDPPQPAPGVPEPWLHFTAEQLAAATQCPRDAIVEHWPRIVAQLEACGINDRDVQAAMIGTVAIESASTFAPVREAFWLSEEWRRANLRYYPWYGRGYIQLTWESNYAAYGQKVNELWGAGGAIDLIARPDDALDPDVSAAVSALYFRDHGREDGEGIPEAARRGDWREVRRLVQGADAGLDRLTAITSALLGTAPPDVTERMYGVDVPDAVIFQQNTWTCAVRATYAALWALAEQGVAEPVTYGDGGPRDVYDWLVPRWDAPNIGLLDHTGAGLAQVLRGHGYQAGHAYPVSLEDVRARAGAQPVLLGGDVWNHWVYVRGRTNDGGLILENPSPGHAGINDYLRDSFDKLGPMAMVWIDPVPAVQPGTPLDVLANRLELARAGLDDGVARPTAAMLKAELHANLEQAWENIDAAYAEIGLIGDELRRVGREAL